ncbi:hypothetical protein KW805_02885 [Candidatus Pacearchaeota archaeon]|nr:hypothetical protein [Candidatus Pacearchaeota archaeon]
MDKQRKLDVSIPVPLVVDFYFILDKKAVKPLYISADKRLFTKEEYRLFESGADLVYTGVGIYRKRKHVSFAREISRTNLKQKTTMAKIIPITFFEYVYQEDYPLNTLALFDS